MYEDAYLTAAPSVRQPSVIVTVGKVDNGFVVSLSETRKQPGAGTPRKPRSVRPPNPFVGMDPDEAIDRMIDGFGAVLRAINDKGAGEDWKDEDDRQKVRDAFKVMFPGFVQQVTAAAEEPGTLEFPDYVPPRNEQRVFEKKEELIEYLKSNL